MQRIGWTKLCPHAANAPEEVNSLEVKVSSGDLREKFTELLFHLIFTINLPDRQLLSSSFYRGRHGLKGLVCFEHNYYDGSG